MAKTNPNDPCPCDSGSKFKKCCSLYLKGKEIENAERLLRTRYVAYVNNNIKFLWETSHPHSPRRLNDTWSKFEREHQLMRGLTFHELKILDEDYSKKNTAKIVFWVKVTEAGHDLSFVEESEFQLLEGKWYYFDGLRRNAGRLGCAPESIRIGELETLFLHDSQLN